MAAPQVDDAATSVLPWKKHMVMAQYLFLSKVLETLTLVRLSRRASDALVLSKGQPGTRESQDRLPGPAFPPPLLFFRQQLSWGDCLVGCCWKSGSLTWAGVQVSCCVYSFAYFCVLVAQSCLTLCDPMDCSAPGSSVHRNLQARTLEWVSVFFSRGSSRPRDRTQVSCIAGRFFALWVTKEVLILGALQFLLWKLRIIVLTSVCS